MATYTIIIKEDRDRRFALDAVRRARFGMQVKISKPKRTPEQNTLLHACITDISKQVVWPRPPRNDGELQSVEWWKRRCTLAWLKENKDNAEIVEGLEEDGTFGILLPHTSDLDIPQCASMIEWVFAFGAQNGVVFTEKKPDIGPEPPPPNPEDYR